MNNQLCESLLLALLLPLPALAERVDFTDSSVHWQSLPGSESSIPASQTIWGVLPPQETLPADSGVIWEPLLNEAGQQLSPTTPSVVWQSLKPGEPDLLPLVPIDPKIAALSVPLPPVPALQSFNRSIAFSDGGVGPDINMRVPSAFIWTPHHWIDISTVGFSRREEGESFWSWNDGDAIGQININLINAARWSLGVNHSFRSVYQSSSSSTGGSTTSFGEGQSSGFRLAYALDATSGIAFGGEQIIQWDEFTDEGRTFYLTASKGWWLGSPIKQFPLLIGTVGLATGRWASDPTVQLGCFDTGEQRTDTYAVDNELCLGPIGSLSLVFNSQLSMFTEFHGSRWVLGASLAPFGEIPFRATWGVNILNESRFQDADAYDPSRLTWSFRLSLGF